MLGQDHLPARSPTAPPARQALRAGEIQGFDYVDPADLGALKSAGFQIIERPAVQRRLRRLQPAKTPLDNPKIRQAIAHALNREALVKPSTRPAPRWPTQFMPPSLFGYTDDVAEYDYDVDKAKAAHRRVRRREPDAGVLVPDRRQPAVHARPGRRTSRPSQGRPRGRRLQGRPEVRRPGTPTTSTRDTRPGPACSLLGWTGDFGDPDNFVGTFFRTQQPAVGFDYDATIYTDLDAARAGAGRGQARPRCTRPATRRSWSSCRVCRTRTPSRRSRSPRTSRATCPAR